VTATAIVPLPSTRGQLQALYGGLDRGYVVTSYPRPDDKWRSACWTPDELDRAAEWCATVCADGLNVYVRATTLTEPVDAHHRGRIDQTGAVVALWADLDVAGPGHQPTPSGLPHPPDLGSVRLLLADLGAVPSITVHTGGGVHPWWLLERPWHLDTPEALTEAKAFVRRWSDNLVELGRRRGWHVDSVHDLTRVLRVCGTTRYKPGVTPNMVTLDACGTWPPHGLDMDGRWRPGPLYTLEQLEPRMITPQARLGADRSTPQTRLGRRVGSQYGPADAVSEALDWHDILAPAGWTHVGNSTVDGSPVELWLRPGEPSSAFSAKCSPDGWAIVWSSAAGLPAGPGQRLNKWRIYCHLRHGGDESAAAKEIRELSRRCPA